MKYKKQTVPYRVPTADGKIIAEHFGKQSTGDEELSIAHMIAPPGWSEPYQIPEFDEYTLMVRGKKVVEIDGERVILKAGESICVFKGSKVKYANPFDEDTEYWSVCIPAFSLQSVHRENS
ncbi:MAG: cupin domain-containing protein [Desulfobacterales bacterium]